MSLAFLSLQSRGCNVYQLPTEFALVPSGRLGYGETISGPAYDLLFGANHWLFSNMGARTGFSFDGTVRQFTTSSVVQTVVNSAGARDLDSLPLYLKPQRPEIDSPTYIPGGGSFFYALEIVLDATDLVVEIEFLYATRDAARNGVTVSPPGAFTIDQPTASRGIVRAFVMLEMVNDPLLTDESIVAQVTAAQSTGGAATGELFNVTITEAGYVNQSSYLATLEANGSQWPGLFGTGDTISTWDPDGSAGFFRAPAPANEPPVAVDFIGPRYSAANFGGGPEHMDAINLPLVGATEFYAVVCLTQPVVANAVVWDLFDPVTSLPSARLRIAAGSLVFEMWDTTNTLRTSTQALPADALPHDILCYYDGQELALYLDGTQGGVVVSAPGLILRGANPLTMRLASDLGLGSFFVGQLAGPQLYTTPSLDILRLSQYRKSTLGIANYANVLTR